jgi:predicted nucleic acid-binding protein
VKPTQTLRATGSIRTMHDCAGYGSSLRTSISKLGSRDAFGTTIDLKIAAIVLRHSATLLSANLRDFRQVPGLSVEDWLA